MLACVLGVVRGQGRGEVALWLAPVYQYLYSVYSVTVWNGGLDKVNALRHKYSVEPPI